MNKNFNKFLDSHAKSISEKQSKRILENFTGQFTPTDLAANILAEVNLAISDMLEAYNDWLFSNFDISPKKKDIQ